MTIFKGNKPKISLPTGIYSNIKPNLGRKQNDGKVFGGSWLFNTLDASKSSVL
jgi:hypothetical protein